MLLMSLAALALFYLAPTRFGAFIGRLPGESFIRTALVFAPATLFAIVLLAALYAVERTPQTAVEGRADASPTRPAKAQPPQAGLALRRQARLGLVPALGLLFASLAVWGVSQIAPDGFGRLLEPLPGTSLLRQVVGIAPVFLFGLATVLFWIGFGARAGPSVQQAFGPWISGSGVNRLAVIAVLSGAGLMLFLSLAGLALYAVSPERLESLVRSLPSDALIRLAMFFAPVIFLTIVLLAGLYLVRPAAVPPGSVARLALDKRTEGLRSNLAVAVLSGGLLLTAALGAGLAGLAVLMILRAR